MVRSRGLFLFLFCFDSFIYNQLHAARKAMTATLPLPPRGAATGFSRLTFSYPELACTAIHSRVSQSSFSSQSDKKKKGKTKGKREDKGGRQRKKKYILEGRAWPILLFVRTYV